MGWRWALSKPGHLDAWGWRERTGQTVEDVEQWPVRISAVTVEQVNAAARAVLRRETATTGILLPLGEGGRS